MALQRLKVAMFDYDKASSADPMGFAEVPISGLPANKEIWIKKKLQDGEVGTSSRVHM